MKGPAFGVRRLDAALHFRDARANLPRRSTSVGGLSFCTAGFQPAFFRKERRQGGGTK